MAMTPRLEVRQSQHLTLTPQLMQSIRLLQLSHLELNAFVDAELERNPLLERDEAPDADPVDNDAVVEHDDYAALGTQDEVIGSAEGIASSIDSDVSDVFPEQTGQDAGGLLPPRAEPGAFGAAGEGADLEAFVAAEHGLTQTLEEQLSVICDTHADRLIAHFLIDNLDGAGYLTIDDETACAQLGCDAEHFAAVLEKAQSCDPTGVFARSLSECLALQLREKDRLDPLMQALLDNLELVANHDLNALCRRLGTDREDVVDMLAELRHLDPKPGLRLDSGVVQTVVPDVFVRPGNGGVWEIELNTDVLPKVLVNRAYYAKVSRTARGSEDKSYLTDCLHTASWLTKSLDQRAQTILKVATEIVRQQDGFLVHGISHLRPMTLKMVAEAIEMHESTVSRVTSHKYISTPRGVFEMKYFFTTALSSTSGVGDHSAEAVRHRIKQLIDAESPSAILSDDTIAEQLKSEQGIDVARRTVAKYREGMNIPSSVVRRRQKRAMVAAE